MKDYPKGGLLGKAQTVFQYIADLKIPLFAAHACYFIVLALFPTLILLLWLLRHTGISVDTFTAFLEGIIPNALLPGAKRLIISTYANTSGSVISLSAVTALWSASRGMHGLLTALNHIYTVPENRGYFYTRGVSVLYTFLFLLVLLLTLVLHVFGTTLLQYLPLHDSPFLTFLGEIIDFRFFLLLFLQTALFTAMFMVLPNRRNRFWDSLPGALLSSCGWLTFSDLFSIYVEHFSGYANIYGSVYAVALSMLWLYFCICIVFYGGALNYYLIRCRQKKESDNI